MEENTSPENEKNLCMNFMQRANDRGTTFIHRYVSCLQKRIHPAISLSVTGHPVGLYQTHTFCILQSPGSEATFHLRLLRPPSSR